jgi:hypothetical protein
MQSRHQFVVTCAMILDDAHSTRQRSRLAGFEVGNQ